MKENETPHREDLDLAAYLDRLVPPASEAAYERMAAYGFARRFVAGRRVADICWEEMGHGSRLLAETAASVVGMTVSAGRTAEVASRVLAAPSVSFETVDPSRLSYPDEHFDVMVAAGVVEHLDRPEELLAEARRVLKDDGVLVVSFPDGPPSTARDVRASLEGRFEQVRLYRLGAVSGGAVFPLSTEAGGASLESVSLSPTSPRPGAELPPASSVVAVCGGTGLGEDGRPYLLLDRDRRVFDENADRAEEVEGLRDEIESMQRTEVQAFRDSLKLRNSEISYLRAEIRRLRRSEAEAKALRTRIRDMENSTTWRVFEPYRQLRARLERARGHAREGEGGKEDR